MTASPRMVAMALAVDSGRTLADVAGEYGVTRQAVSLAYKRARGHGIGRDRLAIGALCRRCGLRYARDKAVEHNASAEHLAARDLLSVSQFWARVEYSDTCWEWRGCRDRAGYGRWRSARIESSGYAHRAAYVIVNGPIPDGLTIDHLCRNRGCVNPSHLEAVTYQTNTLRSPIALAAINARKTRCSHGHEFSPDNTVVVRNGRKCRMCASRGAA